MYARSNLYQLLLFFSCTRVPVILYHDSFFFILFLFVSRTSLFVFFIILSLFVTSMTSMANVKLIWHVFFHFAMEFFFSIASVSVFRDDIATEFRYK